MRERTKQKRKGRTSEGGKAGGDMVHQETGQDTFSHAVFAFGGEGLGRKRHKNEKTEIMKLVLPRVGNTSPASLKLQRILQGCKKRERGSGGEHTTD